MAQVDPLNVNPDKKTNAPRSVPANQKLVAGELNSIIQRILDLISSNNSIDQSLSSLDNRVSSLENNSGGGGTPVVQPPSISVDNTKTLVYGDISLQTFSYSITKGDNDIASIDVDGNGIGLGNVNSSGSLSFQYSFGSDGQNDASFTITVTDAEGNVTTKSSGVRYSFRQFRAADAVDYINTGTDAELSTLLIGASKQFASNINDVEYLVTVADEFPYFAFPASFGTVNSVLLFGFPFDDFTTRTFTFTNENGFSETFTLLRLGSNPTTSNNAKYEINA